jgi:kynurenine formamidase
VAVAPEESRVGAAVDAIFFNYIHGTGTHLDALCHMWTRGEMYNGWSGNWVRSAGAMRLGIENVGGIATRGILLDVAGHRGMEILDPDDLITEDDLLECARSEGVDFASGDAVLVRTGWMATYASDPTGFSGMQPGLSASAGLLLARRDVCLVGADNAAVEAFPGSPAPNPDDPRHGLHSRLHVAFLRNLGIYLLEMLDLDRLAAERIYEFQFALAPLLIDGGSGSPVNPLAIA